MSGSAGTFKAVILNVAVILAILLSFNPKVLAYGRGELIPVGGTHTFEFDISAAEMKVGEKLTLLWDLGGNYYTDIYCSTAISTNKRPNYYSTKTDMVPSKKNPGYYFFNEYLDVAIEIWIEGKVKSYSRVPFEDESNKLLIEDKCTPPRTRHSNFITSGSRGRLTFKLTKPLINGININSFKMVEMYGRYGLFGSPAYTEPMARVILRSGIITVPDKCVINGGNPIAIEFGPVGSTSAQLNGENYQKPLSLSVECKGGSFNAGPLNINMALQPSGSGVAGFNPDYLGTTGTVDRKDLGVVIRNSANQVIKPNTFYGIDSFNDNRGRWDLTAAPIAKPGTDIPEGEFHSNATIVAQFQ